MRRAVSANPTGARREANVAADERIDDTQREAAQEEADHDQVKTCSTNPFASMTEEELDSFFEFLERNTIDESPYDG